MNALVKMLTDDDQRVKDNPCWCLVDPCNEQGPATLCTQEFFGEGESRCTFETKTIKRGGITCPHCLRKLRIYKSILI